MPTARASELPVLIVNGVDSPRSRIGRGLESIGGMTAETLQRISTAVGGVVKSPVVLMAKVGGLASPRAATLSAPPGSSLEERVYHLEIQMRSLEEKFNSMTIVTELDLSTHSHKEKPRIAKSLLQEMEMDKMLEKRVQMLEGCVNERMERFEKALSSIQSRLDHVEFSKREGVVGYECQESLFGEPQYYDAEQQSDNFEASEAIEQDYLGAHDVSNDTIGGSSTLEKSHAKETLSAIPTTAGHIEPLHENDVGKNDDSLEPQVVSTPVYSKEAFLTQPFQPRKSTTPSSGPAESNHRDDVGNLLASPDQQLASTLEELHGSYVTESSTTLASAKFLEIARAVTVEKSTLAEASSEPQSAFVLKEPREVFPKEQPVVVPIAKFEEHAEEEDVDKSSTNTAVVEPPLPPTFEATQKDSAKDLLATAPNAKLAQELATQGVVIIALASSESLVTSKPMEEPLMTIPSANFEESTQEDIGDKSVTITGAGESPKASALQDRQEDFAKESLVSAPSAQPTHEPASREDSSDMELASSKSVVASKSMEEPSVILSGANFEESTQEDVLGKSGNTIVALELPLASSLEEPQEEPVKEFMAHASSVESTQVLETQQSNDIQVAVPESQMASKFVEELSIAAPSVDSKEPTYEDVADKTGTTMGATKSTLTFTLEEPKEGFQKESMTSTPSGESTQEHSDMAVLSSAAEGASKSMKETSVVAPSANFGEHEHKVDVDESGTIIAGVELPLTFSFDSPQEDFEKESSVATSSVEPTQELATQEDSSMVLVAPETTIKSKFAEGLSTRASANFEELAHEDADKGVTTTTPISYGDPQEGFEKESLGVARSVGPIHELPSQEDSVVTSNKALASFEPQVASKFVEESSSIVPSANSKELVQDGIMKSNTMIASVKSPLASSFEESHEDFEKESLATTLNHKPTQELATDEDSHMASTSSESQDVSKFVEEPSIVVSSANFEEPIHEDVVDKSVAMTATGVSPFTSSFEGPQEDSKKESIVVAPSIEPAQELEIQEDSDVTHASSESKVASKFVEEPSVVVPSTSFEERAHEDAANKSVTMIVVGEDHEGFVKESLTALPNAELAHELSSQKDLDATSDMAFASSAPYLASKFVEKPSLASANSEEPTHDKDSIKCDIASDGVDSPLASSFEESHEDFEKESLATTLSHKSIQELTTEEDSHMAPIPFESQEVSKSMEEPSAAIPSVDFEEPIHEDVVDKSVAMTAIRVPPFASSFEEPQEDSKKESSTTNVPSVKSEEPKHEDTIDMNGSIIAAIESPSMSSLEAHREDSTKESLAAGANAKVLEPIEEDESEKSPIAFAPLEVPSLSFLGIPQEAFSKEPSGTSIQLEEPTQEKSGIMIPSAKPTLTSIVEDDNHAAKEAEYKLAEDFKVHHEHIKSIEKEFPRSLSNFAHIGSDESLVAGDNDDRLESDQSGEEFFDAEHGSGNFEPWESDESKSFEESGVGPNEPTGINVVSQKATLGHTSSMEHVQESEQEPTREPVQELEQAPTRELTQESEQELDQTPAQELEQDYESIEQAHAQEREQPAQEQEQHAQEPELEQRPIQEHKQQFTQEHGQETGQEHGQETRQEHGQATTEALGQEPTQEHGQQLVQEPMQVHAQEQEQHTQEPEQHLEQELEQWPTQARGQQPIQEHGQETGQEHGQATTEAPGQEPTQELGHKFEQPPMQELEQEDLTRNSAMALPPSDTTNISSTPHETLEREPLTATPTIENAQGHDIGKSGAILSSLESQLTTTLEEPQEGFVKEPLVDVESTSKSMDFKESLANEPSAVTSAKLAQENVIDKISAGLVEESPLTSIAEEPQNGKVSSLVEGKYGQDEVDHKFLEDVKIIAEPIEEAIPRTQSDMTHIKLNPEVVEDATKLQSQGSFLTFGATSVDSKEDLVKEPLPSSKLLELFEEENNSRMRGSMLVDSPMTSTIEEPQKPLAEESLASAKSVPKGHTRRRGFSRSSSEPQFVYKLEEHRKALAKESSVAAVPSASKLGEEHAQEDFGDTQCLPFRILGEGKHPRKESEFKLMEDVKSPVMKSETTSSPYVLEPKPSKIKEKKEKKKKEKKLDATVEEKERRLSLGLGEMERKSSLRAEEKDSKYSPRAEEKHKQPFRHFRDRLRHAFSVNKEP